MSCCCPNDLLHCACCLHCLQVRKEAGIGARSKVEILAAEQDMYVSRTTGEVRRVVQDSSCMRLLS